jgi:hypothetical protein
MAERGDRRKPVVDNSVSKRRIDGSRLALPKRLHVNYLEDDAKGFDPYTLLFRAQDAIDNPTGDSFSKRLAVKIAARHALEAPDASKFGLAVVSPGFSQESGLDLSDPAYSQYYLLVSFYMGKRLRTIAVLRDDLIMPRAVTTADKEKERERIDQLVTMHASKIEPIPEVQGDEYKRVYAEMRTVVGNAKARFKEEGGGHDREFQHDDRLVIPLARALQLAEALIRVPPPEIIQRNIETSQQVLLQFKFKNLYTKNYARMLVNGDYPSFGVEMKDSYIEFPLDRLKELAETDTAGAPKEVDDQAKAAKSIIKQLQAQGIIS